MIGTGIVFHTLQIVDYGEVVAFAFLRVHRKGMRDVDRRINVGLDIGRDHAAEQRGGDASRKDAGVAQRLHVRPRAFGPFRSRCLGALSVTPMLLRYLLRFVGKVGYLGLAKQQGLSIRTLVSLVPVDCDLERRRNRLDCLGIVAGSLQRLNHSASHGLTRPNAGGCAVDLLDRVVAVGLSPVALQTLR